ncbi:unnamed protein product [Periconia digitata]|uniref:Uncharacterized protein n=1 Tax=Periconia digitata TaxID=1303443 RepID=A0A9W4UHC8_9PLEO|nr:unnamed protein product [Periconia digitata]
MLFSTITLASLVGLAASVDMSRYAADLGVESEFKDYLEELYVSAEDPSATTGFTNFFTIDGQLLVLGNTATGADEIQALKQELLPFSGEKHWNHFPNTTKVDSETSAQKTYQVLGVIETKFDGGNCSQAYYSTRFILTKDGSGSPQFITHAGNLVAYNDYIVDPPHTPTDIACGT